MIYSLEKILQDSMVYERQIKGIYDELQDLLTDNKVKKIVSDCRERLAKNLKFMEKIEIGSHKQEIFPDFNDAEYENMIPKLEFEDDVYVLDLLKFILDYETKLQDLYKRLKADAKEQNIKDVFEKLIQFKKNQIRAVNDVKQSYSALI